MIVVDASALAELLLRTPLGVRVAERLTDAGDLNAPEFIEIELMSVFRKLLLSGSISVDEVEPLASMYDALGLHLHSARPLLERILSYRDNLSAYDAAYVALAEGLDVTLLTTDQKLAHAPNLFAAVDLVVG